VVQLAVTTIEGCDLAGIFMLERGAVTTLAYTDPVLVDLDALQRRSHEGPCLDAIARGLTFYAAYLADDPRWPRFGPEVTAKNIRTHLAVPLVADGTREALNLYALYPRRSA
jgi:GAF domain